MKKSYVPFNLSKNGKGTSAGLHVTPTRKAETGLNASASMKKSYVPFNLYGCNAPLFATDAAIV
jgi:hypothetical protein